MNAVMSLNEPLITYRGVVYPWHCDHMGHMNVMWYVGKFDEATWNLFGVLGLSPSYLRDNERGMVAVEQHITYKRELVAGDTVWIRSRLLEVREKVLRFAHEMINSEPEAVASVTELTGVHIDKSTRRSIPLAGPILERARSLCASR